jgi:hypothetical protein
MNNVDTSVTDPLSEVSIISGDFIASIDSIVASEASLEIDISIEVLLSGTISAVAAETRTWANVALSNGCVSTVSTNSVHGKIDGTVPGFSRGI